MLRWFIEEGHMADSFTSSTVQSGESAAIVRKGVAIAGIQVSVKKSEAHTYTSQATELAMESGATVTDHVILKPVTLAVTVRSPLPSAVSTDSGTLTDQVRSLCTVAVYVLPPMVTVTVLPASAFATLPLRV